MPSKIDSMKKYKLTKEERAAIRKEERQAWAAISGLIRRAQKRDALVCVEVIDNPKN